MSVRISDMSPFPVSPPELLMVPNALQSGLESEQCSLDGVDELYDTALDVSVCVTCHK